MTTTQKEVYDFEVSLEPITCHGKVVPKFRSVWNKDIEEPITVVSSGYNLVPHSHLVDTAQELVHELGPHETRFTIGKKGAAFLGEYTFKHKPVEVKKGDLVGLKLYLENSYNRSKSGRIRVGGLVLSCLNGAVSERSVFDFSFRHIGKEAIDIPTARSILDAFSGEVQRWRALAKTTFTQAEYVGFAHEAVENGIIPLSATTGEASESDLNAWGLYNRFTYHITHKEKANASAISRVRRLERVSKFFNERFGV